MKAKKAVKRLMKAEALLSNVIDQFAASKQEVGELLAEAKAAVIRARETVDSQLSATAINKTSGKAQVAHATARDGKREAKGSPSSGEAPDPC